MQVIHTHIPTEQGWWVDKTWTRDTKNMTRSETKSFLTVIETPVEILKWHVPFHAFKSEWDPVCVVARQLSATEWHHSYCEFCHSRFSKIYCTVTAYLHIAAWRLSLHEQILDPTPGVSEHKLNQRWPTRPVSPSYSLSWMRLFPASLLYGAQQGRLSRRGPTSSSSELGKRGLNQTSLPPSLVYLFIWVKGFIEALMFHKGAHLTWSIAAVFSKTERHSKQSFTRLAHENTDVQRGHINLLHCQKWSQSIYQTKDIVKLFEHRIRSI